MFANGSVSLLGLCEGECLLRLRSTVAEAFTVLTGREADENLFVSLLYVLNVVNVASWRGVGGVVVICAPRWLRFVIGCVEEMGGCFARGSCLCAAAGVFVGTASVGTASHSWAFAAIS